MLGILNIHITHHNTGNRRFGKAYHHNGGIHITDRHTRHIDITKFRSTVTLRFGSEMSGGVKKVTISNCVFDGTDRGIRLKSTRGRGGIVEDIRVSNIVMSNIKKEAIVLNLKYSKMPAEPKSDRTPEFRNIYVSGVTVRDVNTPIIVVGLPEAPITGIVMRDVYIQNAKQRCVFEDCKDLVLDDVYVDGKEIK